MQRQRAKHAERLAAMRERVARSIGDPRPSLTEAEVGARLDRLFDAAR